LPLDKEGVSVRIDAQSRRDLELVRTRDGSPGCVDMLDMTRTRGGSRCLRTRFENPSADAGFIREVQEGLGFLLAEKVAFPAPRDLVESVARYLDSAWDVASKRRGFRFLLDVGIVQLRYRGLLRFAREGVRAVAVLMEHVLPFLEDLLNRDPPSLIRTRAETLLNLNRDLRLQDGLPWGGAVRVLRQDRHLRKTRLSEIREFMEGLYDLDALLAMAAGVERFGMVFPELVTSEEPILEGEGVFHIFLEAPVGNPVQLSEGDRLVFLTGPNMAGKTTYLKAVCIAVYLAHVGMGVPAKRFRLTPLDALFSSLAPEESLREGLSYFMAEVRRVREVASAVARGERALVVFDEVFRGTNVKDALDASMLVIRGFSRIPNCRSLFSSHLVELGEGLAQEPGVRFRCFEGELRDGRAVYPYVLKDGVSDQRFGLHLLEQEGVRRLLSGRDPSPDSALRPSGNGPIVGDGSGT